MRSGLLTCILAALFLSALPLSALDFKVRVFDPQLQKGLPDAQVVILETKQKFYTDENGETTASVPNPGTYTFRLVLPTGIQQPRFEIRTANQLITILTQENQAQRVTNEGIEVVGIREKSRLSRYEVRLDEVKRIPGQFGEALKGIESLPGVNAPAFGTGDVIIRGANTNANLYLLDGLPIGYAFHLLGLNAVVHNDLIKSLDLYTGTYTAEYGDATGGVISIETNDQVERFSGFSSFSLFSANVLFQSPILDDAGQRNGYWIASARNSYMEKTLGQYIPEGIRAPHYYDGQFKMQLLLTPTQKLYVYLLGSKDTFGANINDKPTLDPVTEPDPVFIGARVALDRAFHTEAIRHVYQPTKWLKNEFTVLNFDNIFYVNGKLGSIDLQNELHNGYAAIRDKMTLEAIPNHVLFEVGGEIRTFIYRNYGRTARSLDPNDRTPNFYDTTNPAFVTVPTQDKRFTAYDNAFVQAALRYGGFEFKPGVRYDYFGLTKQGVGSPRATLSYAFPTQTTITAGAGMHYRVPDPNQYSPTSGNPDLRMEKAEHVGLAIEQVSGPYTFKLEGFRHLYKDMVESDPYITTPVALNLDPWTKLADPILYNSRLYFSNDGTGDSRGIEVFIKKTKKENEFGWYGWLSYTWSITHRNTHQHIISKEEAAMVLTADERRILNQVDNQPTLYADFDRRNILNLVFGYRFNREWQLGAKWRYSTSTPYTQITGDDGAKQNNNGRPIFDPVYSEQQNTVRLGPFHRLDLRLDRYFNYEWGYGNFFMELLNVYLRDNPDSLSWNRAIPFSASNPTVGNDFGTLEVPAGKRRFKVPLTNLGVEVKF